MSTQPVYVGKPSDLPPGEHFVIITFSSFVVPGDERSHTHPGHGYGEHTETSVTCVAYATREEWVAEIGRLTSRAGGSMDWLPIVAHVPEVSATVKVDVR